MARDPARGGHAGAARRCPGHASAPAPADGAAVQSVGPDRRPGGPEPVSADLYRLLSRRGRSSLPRARPARPRVRDRVSLPADRPWLSPDARVPDPAEPRGHLEARRVHQVAPERQGVRVKRRAVLVTLVVAGAMAMATGRATGAPLAAVRDRGTLTVCAHPDALPFSAH